ncbi:uncharacterized protein LAESUDRAFT_706510 [Laetiporus sulphureus 93-53]|uniref:Peptidase C14 caspase domain-containing protein n=1 Tax=Laetiporus sulphureus 93-53 TaxID=1314785 RepID=A0A165C5K7_9APHY|nr:uncharacterized protein LAESUDRAFT_706510 [Laetiporus sulphureus 93-53]KZT02245.1 hypothetical protein LAESUDRAFT_706510 [Laetiporus sulphureus 93-53]
MASSEQSSSGGTGYGSRTFAHHSDGHEGFQAVPEGDFWKNWHSICEQRWNSLTPLQRGSFESLISIEKEIEELTGVEETIRQDLRMEYGEADPVEMRRMYRDRCKATKSRDDWDKLMRLCHLHTLNKEKNSLLWVLAQGFPLSAERIQSAPISRLQDVQSSSARIPPLWAVIIGIDSYPRARLHGAVKDAKNMQQYLVESLHVPDSNIVMLLNQHATRENIIKTLYDHLHDNGRIEHGDAIFIHFSGHGASYPARSPSSESVEAIAPVDRGTSKRGKHAVTDISDRELNLFLGDLRERKGPNITLTLDCCFANGVTRGGHSVRRTDPLGDDYRPMLRAAEQNPRKRWRTGSTADGVYSPNAFSHVLLAACHDYEQAVDTDEGGAFTVALLRQLRSVHLNDTTYPELLQGIILPSARQTPVASGRYKDNFIFRIGHGRIR